MLKDYKILMVNTRLYSLHFSEAYKKPLWPIVLELKKLFSAETEITNTFNRINLIFSHDQQKDEVVATVAMLNFGFKAENGPTKIWEIPICFDPIFSNDLADVFSGNQQEIEVYKKGFLATVFTLKMYGFLPGFGYLSGLPKELHLDRKSNPSSLTPKGTVGVGGKQVGVYPQDSPGGWQNIGNCPLPWINFLKEPYVFIAIGDNVRFVEIDLATHKEIALSVVKELYQPNFTGL